MPAAFVQNRRALAGPGHAALLSTALAYPLHLAPSPPNRGCSGPTPLPEPSFVVDPASPRGLLFDRLLQACPRHPAERMVPDDTC